MITSHCIGNYGRFGNQLFQYAMLFGLYKKNGYDFCIPRNPKCTLGDVFDTIKFGEPIGIKQTLMEPNGGATVYFDDINNVPNYTSFVGYFQSPKYFLHCSESLKEHLVIKNQYLSAAKSFVEKYKNLGFIHVRRGDYVASPHCHPPITVDYIKLAVQQAKAKKFVIISDDIAWCKKNLEFLDPLYSPFSERDLGYDFALMTECSSAIISNSSFSWWGAWLGNKKDVIAPSKWFGEDITVPQSWKDVYCEEWTVI